MILKPNALYNPETPNDFIHVGDSPRSSPFNKPFFVLELQHTENTYEQYKILCEYGICEFVILRRASMWIYKELT